MNPHRISHRPLAPCRGVTLIEVLVTMVLLGVGLLGLAGLQARGVQVNQGSAYRAQAANLAADLADRLRADPATTMSGGYNGAYAPPAVAPAAILPLVKDWTYQLGSVPGGTATVQTVPIPPVPPLPALAPVTLTVTVNWKDDRAANGAQPGSGPSTGSYVLVTEISD